MERQQFCREKYSGLIASANSKPKYTKKSLLSNNVPKIHSKKITAAVHCQFLSKAALMPIVSRCNGSEREKKNLLFYDMQHVQRVNPTRCASAGIVRKNSNFVPSSCSDNTMIHLTSTKMRNANCWGVSVMPRRPDFKKDAFLQWKVQDTDGLNLWDGARKSLDATLWHFIVLLFKLRHHWLTYATTCVFVQEWMPLFFACARLTKPRG